MSERMKAAFRSLGKADALTLRNEAVNLTGTEIIDREHCVPEFDPERDYTAYPVGTPVASEEQVWTLLQPYNAAHYPGKPSGLRALWGIVHTTNPAKAKGWVEPYGTSGMYMTGECYRDENGQVYRCLGDNTVFSAKEIPSAWEVVTV